MKKTVMEPTTSGSFAQAPGSGRSGEETSFISGDPATWRFRETTMATGPPRPPSSISTGDRRLRYCAEQASA